MKVIVNKKQFNCPDGFIPRFIEQGPKKVGDLYAMFDRIKVPPQMWNDYTQDLMKRGFIEYADEAGTEFQLTAEAKDLLGDVVMVPDNSAAFNQMQEEEKAYERSQRQTP
jgi:predicted transcriptional regulator